MHVKPSPLPPPPARPRRSRARLLLLLALSAGLLSSGCLLGTIGRLWVTRRQMLSFDEFIRYLPSGQEEGPGIEFLEPRLTPEDIAAVASDRFPSIMDSVDGELRWVFQWVRVPVMRGKAINLDLRFRDNRLSQLRVDKRFSDYLGEERIEMLVRNFVGGKTDLDLGGKRIVCTVPAEELAPFTPLCLTDLRELFGLENKRRSSDSIPEDEIKLIFRYRLLGATGNKAAMSFGATIHQETSRLGRITSRIGSFQLEFDLSQQP